jgi:hypothetical protein
MFQNEVLRIMCNENEVREKGKIMHNGENLQNLCSYLLPNVIYVMWGRMGYGSMRKA